MARRMGLLTEGLPQRFTLGRTDGTLEVLPRVACAGARRHVSVPSPVDETRGGHGARQEVKTYQQQPTISHRGSAAIINASPARTVIGREHLGERDIMHAYRRARGGHVRERRSNEVAVAHFDHLWVFSKHRRIARNAGHDADA